MVLVGGFLIGVCLVFVGFSFVVVFLLGFVVFGGFR